MNDALEISKLNPGTVLFSNNHGNLCPVNPSCIPPIIFVQKMRNPTRIQKPKKKHPKSYQKPKDLCIFYNHSEDPKNPLPAHFVEVHLPRLGFLAQNIMIPDFSEPSAKKNYSRE
jgi:hypothetical protein